MCKHMSRELSDPAILRDLSGFEKQRVEKCLDRELSGIQPRLL